MENSTMTLLRDVGKQHFEDEVERGSQMLFWFPSTMGLGRLVEGYKQAGSFLAVTLDKTDDFALKRVNVNLQAGEQETLAVAQQQVAARPFSIRWQDQVRTLWLDEHKRPVKMVRGDGLAAVETRHIHY